ncbi:MAG: hypothetical protein ACXWC7_20555, partial [Chitinophagaceae bacterium]
FVQAGFIKSDLQRATAKENTYFLFRGFRLPLSIFVLRKYNSFTENNNSSHKITIHVAPAGLKHSKR